MDFPWLDPALADRDMFMGLLSAILLELDTTIIHRGYADKDPGALAVDSRTRSDWLDSLAGINYHRQWEALVRHGVTHVQRGLDFSDLTLPDQLIEYAFRRGYPDLAMEAKSFLVQLPPLRTSKSEGG